MTSSLSLGGLSSHRTQCFVFCFALFFFFFFFKSGYNVSLTCNLLICWKVHWEGHNYGQINITIFRISCPKLEDMSHLYWKFAINILFQYKNSKCKTKVTLKEKTFFSRFSGLSELILGCRHITIKFTPYLLSITCYFYLKTSHKLICIFFPKFLMEYS